MLPEEKQNPVMQEVARSGAVVAGDTVTGFWTVRYKTGKEVAAIAGREFNFREFILNGRPYKGCLNYLKTVGTLTAYEGAMSHHLKRMPWLARYTETKRNIVSSVLTGAGGVVAYCPFAFWIRIEGVFDGSPKNYRHLIKPGMTKAQVVMQRYGYVAPWYVASNLVFREVPFISLAILGGPLIREHVPGLWQLPATIAVSALSAGLTQPADALATIRWHFALQKCNFNNMRDYQFPTTRRVLKGLFRRNTYQTVGKLMFSGWLGRMVGIGTYMFSDWVVGGWFDNAFKPTLAEEGDQSASPTKRHTGSYREIRRELPSTSPTASLAPNTDTAVPDTVVSSWFARYLETRWLFNPIKPTACAPNPTDEIAQADPKHHNKFTK